MRTLKFHENFRNTRVIISSKSLYPVLGTQWSAGGLFWITSHVLGNLDLHFSSLPGKYPNHEMRRKECICSLISMSRKTNCFPKKTETAALLHIYRHTRGATYRGDEALSRKTDKDLNLNFSSLDRRTCELKYPTSLVSSWATEIDGSGRGNIYFWAICLKEGNFPYFFKRNPEWRLAPPPSLTPQKKVIFKTYLILQVPKRVL